MIKSIVRFALFAALALAACGTGARAEEIVYRLPSAQLDCIARNANAYLAGGAAQLIISVPACPKIPANPIADTMVNSGPDLKITDGPDTLIVVTRDELTCLAKTTIDLDHPLYLYYPESCRVVAKDE